MMGLLILKGSVELGIIYAILVLGVFVSFRTLNIPDLTVDGSFVLGAAVSASMCTYGHPFLGIPLAFLAGCAAGCVTSILNTKLKIQPLLSGILTMLALYSINLRVMQNRANIPLLNKPTIFSGFEETAFGEHIEIVLVSGILVFLLISLFLFLKTRIGFALRAVGDNESMARALGVNTDLVKLIGLAVSNGLVGISGALVAQYNSFADIGMGTGMVMIGLASVIIGEVIFGADYLLRRLTAVILGAVLYRIIIAFALELGMPATDLKLISALIVTAALSTKTIKKRLALFCAKRASSVIAKREGVLDVKS